MKKFSLLTMMVISSFLFSQEVLQDFETGGIDSPFGGSAASIVADPQVGGTRGMVAMLTTNNPGEVWQGVNITLKKDVDLTTDKTMKIDVYSLTPFSMAPKVLGGLSGAPASTSEVTHTGSGWETLTITFDKNYDGTAPANGVYHQFVIYQNWNASTHNFLSPVAPRTFYVDNIKGVGVAPVIDPVPPTTTPKPTIYNTHLALLPNVTDSPGFTNSWSYNYDFGVNQGTIDLDPTAVVNNALKMNFSVAGWGAGTNVTSDVTAYDYIHFDYFVPNVPAGVNGHEFRFILIGGGEFPYVISPSGGDATLALGSWQSMNVPLSAFVAKGFSKTNFLQFKLGSESDLKTKIAYFDNIYFYNSTSGVLGVNDVKNANATQIYPNPVAANAEFNITGNVKSVKIYSMNGQLVKTTNSQKVNTQGLSKGVYMVESVQQNGTVNHTKLMVK
jgi:hypothetical protein